MEMESIVEHSADISLMPSSKDAQPQFCSIWPQAKMGLTLLREIIKNPALKVVIGVIISAGDAVAKQLGCTQQ